MSEIERTSRRHKKVQQSQKNKANFLKLLVRRKESKSAAKCDNNEVEG